MANPSLLWIQTDATDKSQSVLNGITYEARPAEQQQFYRSDGGKIGLVFMQRTQDVNSQYKYQMIDPSGWNSIVLAAGQIGATPDSGTFTLTGGSGGTTGAISYSASAATVQTAVRAGMTGFGSAVVTGPDGGPWIISYGSNGAQPDITGSAAALVPSGSTVVIVNSQQGNASLQEQWTVSLAKAYPVLNSTWTALEPAAVSVTTENVGGANANKSQRVRWNADALDGAITFNFVADTTTTTIGPVPYNADSATFESYFLQNPDVVAGDVSVTQNGPGDYTVNFVGGNVANSNTPALTEASNTLIVPIGVQGPVVVSTAGADAILGNEDEAEITFSIQINRAANTPETVVQAPAILYKDLIVNTPGQATGNEDYVTSNAIRQQQTVRVDPSFGDDATGEIARPLDRPFATIAGAISAISALNSILIELAPGYHDVSTDIALPAGCALQGAGKQITKIYFTGGGSLLPKGENTISDLTILADGGPAIKISDDVSGFNGGKVWVNNALINAGGENGIEVHIAPGDLIVSDTEIISALYCLVTYDEAGTGNVTFNDVKLYADGDYALGGVDSVCAKLGSLTTTFNSCYFRAKLADSGYKNLGVWVSPVATDTPIAKLNNCRVEVAVDTGDPAYPIYIDDATASPGYGVYLSGTTLVILNSTSNCIAANDSAQVIICGTSCANQSATGDIILVGGSFIVDSSIL